VSARLQRGMAVAAPRFICFLCKRKFQSAALLQRHKQLSDLHKKNLQRQEEEINHKKEELRQAILGLRQQIQEVDIGGRHRTRADEETQTQRTTLELKLRRALGEYGQAQEKLEVSRHQQVSERGAASTLLKLSESCETQVGRLQLSVGAATWQGNKEVQEDRYMMDIHLDAPGGQRVAGFCVLDGHSGSLCVDALMEWLPRNLQKCLAAKPSLSEDTLRQAITEACVLTDDEFLAKAREREILDGSTMIVCLIFAVDGEALSRSSGHFKMLIANLGDSRAVLCRSQSGGRLSAVRLTEDHKPGRSDERRRIEAAGGVVDMQGVWRVYTPGPANFGGRSVLWGLAVSRAFGDLLLKEPARYGCSGVSGELVSAMPEVHAYDLRPADDRFLVLACDGIWDVLGDEDAVAVCAEHRTADFAAHALVRRAFEVGSDDNLTALVVTWQLGDASAGDGETKRQKVD